MAQFDVHATRGATARLAPFVVVLQTNLLERLNTTVVAPLHLPKTLPKPMTGLHLQVEVSGHPYVLAVEQLVSLPIAMLGRPVASLAAGQADIKRAFDFLLFGI